MSKTTSNRSTSSRRAPAHVLVAKTVEDYRSHLESRADEAFGLVALAAASMAEAAWLVDGEVGAEEVFEHARKNARVNLKDRADRLQTQVLAGEAQSRAAQ
jgi:hypothetical protein